MIVFAGSVVAGATLLHQLAALPDWPWPALLVVALPLAAVRVFRVSAGLLLGFALAGLHGNSWLQHALPQDLTGTEVQVVGSIVGIPDHSPRRSRFVLDIQEAVDAPEAFAARRLRVTVFPPAPELGAGDRIRATLRLRPPRGLHNPAGFDYGTWLYREGIHGSATARGRPEREETGWSADLPGRVDAGRERLRDAMQRAHPDARHPGVMQALVIGERGAMDAHEWRLFLHTGTNHLMAISGLHVGLVAGFALLLARILWRRVRPLRRIVSLGWFGALAAAAAAVVYAALAGFSVPTQRALLMLLLVTVALLAGREPLSWRVYGAALVLVVAMNPANVLAPGFWFSFAAVALILLLLQGRTAHPGPTVWLRLQVILALALLPVSLAWFQLAAWIAPLANLVAVPVVSLPVLPALLAGAALAAVSPVLGFPLLWWADLWLQGLFWVLEGLLLVPGAASERSVALPAVLLAGLGVALSLFPRGRRLWPIAMLLCVPLLWAPAPRIGEGEFRAEMLDVGQGLAVVVRTRGHVLVYDAGPAWEGGLDSGEAVVLPALRRLGASRIDTILVSHEHLDHRGGVSAIVAAMPVAAVLSRRGGPDTGEEPCEAGLHWSWDGVRFSTLHPPPRWDDGNAASCVLAVEGAYGRLLLTGDLEGLGETVLVRGASGHLATDVLLVPHHGASGVLSRGLLEAASPRVAWVSRAHDNRFGHPAADVLARLDRACVPLLDTAERGMLWLHAGPEGIRLGPGSRVEQARFWLPPVPPLRLPGHCSSSRSLEFSGRRSALLGIE